MKINRNSCLIDVPLDTSNLPPITVFDKRGGHIACRSFLHFHAPSCAVLVDRWRRPRRGRSTGEEQCALARQITARVLDTASIYQTLSDLPTVSCSRLQRIEEKLFGKGREESRNAIQLFRYDCVTLCRDSFTMTDWSRCAKLQPPLSNLAFTVQDPDHTSSKVIHEWSHGVHSIGTAIVCQMPD